MSEISDKISVKSPADKKRTATAVTPDNFKGQTKLTFFVKPKRLRETVSTKTPSFKSIDVDYGKEHIDAMPGDIVMSFASDIDHPEYLRSIVPCHYVYFGQAKRFVYVDWDTGDDQFGVVANSERLEIQWSCASGEKVRLKTIPRSYAVKVMVKREMKELPRLNDFLREELLRRFYYADPEGWTAY